MAAFQGPAPVVVLVLGITQTTGHLDLRTALGDPDRFGLGAAVGALLTAPAGARSRRLVQLHLLLGTASTVLALATVRIWSALADRLVAGSPHDIEWGKRVLLPHMGLHLGVALALSQLAIALVLVPLVPLLVKALARLAGVGLARARVRGRSAGWRANRSSAPPVRSARRWACCRI